MYLGQDLCIDQLTLMHVFRSTYRVMRSYDPSSNHTMSYLHTTRRLSFRPTELVPIRFILDPTDQYPKPQQERLCL